MDLKLRSALLVGKIIALVTRLRGGGATAAPGLYALKIDPDLVKKLARKFRSGNIVISGTNGKTTTARLTTNILQTKFKIINNRQGSNLLRGLASTLITSASLTGKVNADIGIWEVDEATLPQALENLKPNTIVLLNLFRDQLDRYGEVDSLRSKWQKSLEKMPKSSTLILNSDDPGIGFLARFFNGRDFYFGVEDQRLNLPQINQVADIRHCLECGNLLVYSSVLSAHMGNYKCPNCGLSRPKPTIAASSLQFRADFSTKIDLTIESKKSDLNYKLPGLYNVYNILAAASTASVYKISAEKIKNTIKHFSSAFGRFQQMDISGKKIIIFLIKNPAGANEVLRTISVSGNLNILALLNDKIADGRDVSWIWDTNWEMLVPKIKKIFVSGTRRWDLALRLKYAGVKLSKNNVYNDINYSIERTLSLLKKKDTLILLPTYTAMLEVQKFLQSKGAKSWHQD